MGIEPTNEGAGVGAAVEFGEIVRKGAILQACLVAGDKHPFILGAKQGSAFTGERLALLRIRNLCHVGVEMLGAVMWSADVNQPTMDPVIWTDVSQPGFLAVRELSESTTENVVFGQAVELGILLND